MKNAHAKSITLKSTKIAALALSTAWSGLVLYVAAATFQTKLNKLMNETIG